MVVTISAVTEGAPVSAPALQSDTPDLVRSR